MIFEQFLYDSAGVGLTSTGTSLNVNITGGGSSGNAIDESAWTAGTSTFFPSGGVFNDSATALTSGQQGTARSTANRALHVNLRNTAGTPLGDSIADAFFTQLSDGTTSIYIAPSSTALVAAHPSLAVALSPNTPLPAGTNLLGGVELVDSGGTNKGAIDASGNLSVKQIAGTATLTQPAAGTASYTVLAANANRKGAIIVNNTNKIQYLAFAATATLAAFTLLLGVNSVYELNTPVYTGLITAIGASGTSGSMVVTELT